MLTPAWASRWIAECGARKRRRRRRLTFELRRERWRGAWPARRMMDHSASRAKCHAGASRLERRVRPRGLASYLPWLDGADAALDSSGTLMGLKMQVTAPFVSTTE